MKDIIKKLTTCIDEDEKIVKDDVELRDEEFIDHMIKLGEQVEKLDPRFRGRDSWKIVHDYFLEHLDDEYRNERAMYPKFVSKRCKVCRSHCIKSTEPGCRKIKIITPVRLKLARNIWLEQDEITIKKVEK